MTRAAPTGDPTGTMETPALAKAGDATYSDFAFRWGDYSGIAIDPTDGSLWSGAEYATSLLSGDPANWATWISHFTLGPSVISSNPAAGSVVTGSPPTTFSLTFSEPIDPASITASDFTVDGVPADSASISADDLTITYTFNTSPVTQEGLESMSLPGGAVKSLSGESGNAAFSANFYYVQTQLQVTATSPAVGSVLTPPITDLVVQFNKAFDPSTVQTSDFQLSQGTVVSAKPLTSSVIDLTLSGITQDGTLTLTVPAGALTDLVGVPNLAFTGTYIVDIVSEPYPVPLAGQEPGRQPDLRPVGFRLGRLRGRYRHLHAATGRRSESHACPDDRPEPDRRHHPARPQRQHRGHRDRVERRSHRGHRDRPRHDRGHLLARRQRKRRHNGKLHTSGDPERRLQAIDRQHQLDRTAYDLTSAFSSLGTTPYADRAGVVGNFGP